jgi:hypothetical protein
VLKFLIHSSRSFLKIEVSNSRPLQQSEVGTEKWLAHVDGGISSLGPIVPSLAPGTVSAIMNHVHSVDFLLVKRIFYISII